MTTDTASKPEGSHVGVWVDQDQDTGHGLAVEICENVFILGPDGLTYTHENGSIFGKLLDGIVVIDPALESSVEEAIVEQPEENIFTEYVRCDSKGNITGIWDKQTKNWKDWAPKRNPMVFEID